MPRVPPGAALDARGLFRHFPGHALALCCLYWRFPFWELWETAAFTRELHARALTSMHPGHRDL
eukprot:9107117-Lingulodinium_polyedra.AAC.1